jgi:hypothetical protein
MTPEQYLNQEQEQRLEYQEFCYEETLQTQASLNNIYLMSGEFDGLLGLLPRYPNNDYYWLGWSSKIREYYAKQNNVTIDNEF